MTRSTTTALCLTALLAAATVADAQDAAAGFDAQFQAARQLALDGQREAALSAYTALLSASPGNTDVLLGRGRLYAWMGLWTQAQGDLVAASELAPTYADVWSALGDVYLWTDQPAEAAAAYGHWVDLAPPDDPAPLIARGKAWRAVGDTVAARADFEAAATRGAEATEVAAYLRSLEPPAPVAEPAALLKTAPTNANGYLWTASFAVDRTHFSGGSDWTDTVTAVRRQWELGSIGFEALTASRFGLTDHAFALDDYTRLWSRAYVNLSYQYAPDAVLYPQNRWRAELFQGVGSGWELSAGYDRLGFNSPVELISFGVARYFGDWYVRLRHLHVPGTATDPASSDSDRLVGRYYYAGDADRYVELSASSGREPSTTTTPFPLARHSWSAGAAWSTLLTRRIGLRLTASTGYGLESEPYRDESLAATLYLRW